MLHSNFMLENLYFPECCPMRVYKQKQCIEYYKCDKYCKLHCLELNESPFPHDSNGN